MATAQINGVELFFTESGTGPPLIALHGGLGFDHTYMKPAFEPLEDELHVIYLDQRCNGRSERVPLDSISMAQLAADVDGLREHLGLDEVALAGHSYGGFVALEYATTYPERLTHLIAMDTSPGMFEPTQDELAERADPSWITPEVSEGFSLFATMSGPDAGLTDDKFRELMPTIAPVYLRSSGNAARLADVLNGTIVNAEVALHSMTKVLPGWSVADKLDRISCPTLVLCGRYDLMTTPECSKRISTAVPGAELVWFENSGHFPDIEEPEAFEAALRSFFARHP